MKKAKILWYGNQLLKKINTEEKRKVKKACIFLERYIKKSFGKSPSSPGEPPGVDTGRLRASITYEIEQILFSITGKIGTNVKYARYLELGTKDMQPRPYLRAAIERNKAEIIKILTTPIK